MYEAHVGDAMDLSEEFHMGISKNKQAFYGKHVDEVRKKEQK